MDRVGRLDVEGDNGVTAFVIGGEQLLLFRHHQRLAFNNNRMVTQADIEQATKLARMMVKRWGLSGELGTVAYGENQDEVFLGYQVSCQQNISEVRS
jgi:ATP-dependent Zn protease